MDCNLHHVHLFASDLDASLRFYREMFGARILFDETVAGVRNVMIQIGTGRINFYDQKPRTTGPGAVHHLGIFTDDIASVVAHMEARGFHFRNPVRDFGELKYIMLEGPDRVLIEIFENKAEGRNQEGSVLGK
ncbi:MAG: VOC family protein [Deltaproteobacteria bacterium]|nr:VOC family protein [Deltaproteobacteria bacterium]